MKVCELHELVAVEGSGYLVALDGDLLYGEVRRSPVVPDDHYAEGEDANDHSHELRIVSCRMGEERHEPAKEGEQRIEDEGEGDDGIWHHERCGTVEECRPVLVWDEHENEGKEDEKKSYEIDFHELFAFQARLYPQGSPKRNLN